MEKLKVIKEKLVECAYEEVEHNLAGVNTCELGEVIDMIKDISETIYYHKVVEAVEESTVEEVKTAVAQHTIPHNSVVPTV